MNVLRKKEFDVLALCEGRILGREEGMGEIFVEQEVGKHVRKESISSL